MGVGKEAEVSDRGNEINHLFDTAPLHCRAVRQLVWVVHTDCISPHACYLQFPFFFFLVLFLFRFVYFLYLIAILILYN